MLRKKAKAEATAETKAEAKPKAKPQKNRKKTGDQGFMLLHVEKIVLVVVVLASLYLAYSGLTGYQPLSWEPQELAQAANQADEHIKNSNVAPREFDENLLITPYDEKATWIKRDITQIAYATDRKWEPTLFPDKIKRVVPMIYPVESLRAIPGNGPILVIDRSPQRPTGGGMGMGGAMGGGMGMDGGMGMGGTMGGTGTGTKLEAKKWIVLTGLIPIRKQLTEYLNRFSDSMFTSPVIDTPMFVTYEIERSEYDPVSRTALNWEKIDAALQYTSELDNWAGMGAEKVDHSYLAPQMQGMVPMAYPLPPMVQKLFGEEIAYPPYVPLLADSLIESMEQQEKMLEDLKKFKPVDNNQLIENLNRMNFTGAGMGGSGMGGSGMGAGGMGAGGMGVGGMGMDSGMGAGGMGMGGMGAGGMGMGGMGMGGDTRRGVNTGIFARESFREYVPPTLVDHYLFRFFDFDVEDEKSYAYRVRLILKNPNHNLDPKFLEDESSNQDVVLYSEFSDPSQPMSAGRMSRVLVKDVTAPTARRASQETSIKLLPIYFDMDDANEWVSNDEKTVLPGMIANFPSTTTFNPRPDNQQQQQPGVRQTPPGSRTPTKTVNIVSDVAFLGAYGGFPVEGNGRSPAKVLLMDANGTVVLRNLGTDLDESDNYSKTATQNRGAGSMMGPGMMGPGM